jgi:hypothetical protein
MSQPHRDLVLVLSQPANAETLLWRTLAEGQSPDQAKAQLETMQEVKRVKNIKKRGSFNKQDVNMNEGKLLIFDGYFSIQTIFKNERLSQVVLTSGAGCLYGSYSFAEKMDEELSKKYPVVELPLLSSSDYTMRALDSTDSIQTSISSIYQNDEIVLILRSSFIQVKPPVYYGGSALAQSIYNIARTSYDAGARACGGSYYRTAQFSVSYLSRSEWNDFKKTFESEDTEERKAASENL